MKESGAISVGCKHICGPVANNWGKCLILLVTVLLIEEEWLSLFTLLNTGLSRQFFFWEDI